MDTQGEKRAHGLEPTPRNSPAQVMINNRARTRVSGGKVAQQRNARRSVPAVVAAVLLIFFSATGLMAGQLAHALTANVQATSTTGDHHVNVRPPLPTPTPTATSTPKSLVTTSFALSLAVQPNPVPAGARLTIQVTATAQDTAQPIAGLTCIVQSPRPPATEAPLLQQWPAPVTTNAAGSASWTVPTTGIAPGTYGIEVQATGAGGYNYHSDASITVMPTP